MALVSMANVLMLGRKYTEARLVLEAALDITDTLYAIHYIYGCVTATIGDLMTAHTHYQRALALQPGTRPLRGCDPVCPCTRRGCGVA